MFAAANFIFTFKFAHANIYFVRQPIHVYLFIIAINLCQNSENVFILDVVLFVYADVSEYDIPVGKNFNYSVQDVFFSDLIKRNIIFFQTPVAGSDNDIVSSVPQERIHARSCRC